MYKVTFAEQKRDYRIASGSATATEAPPTWEETGMVAGPAEVVAGALRAYADKIDPKKPATRGYGE